MNKEIARVLMAAEWVWSEDYKQFCRIIETRTLWSKAFSLVWVPEENIVVEIPAERLQKVAEARPLNVNGISYIVTAAKILDSLGRDILLAPFSSSVIPLPHQIRVLGKAVSDFKVRYLLADEVGLGKTIEAGLILKELKLRGSVTRTLIIAPRGLIHQWVSEMALQFNEQFHPIMPADYRDLKRVLTVPARVFGMIFGTEVIDLQRSQGNPFRLFDQVIVSMDAFKPNAWNQEAPKEAFEDLVDAGWDLVIIDEAHRLGGSSEKIGRHRFGKRIAEAAPYLLLLSATPHQGKTEQFHRLISLLDPEAFPDPSSLTKDKIKAFVIRTEKRNAIDPEGKPLFTSRHTQLVGIKWEKRHEPQRMLYEAVTEYVRHGYNKAIQERRTYIGFLMVLLQRLVTSSTRAIRETLEKRLQVIRSEMDLNKRLKGMDGLPDGVAELSELEGEELRQILIQVEALQDEEKELEHLIQLALECERQSVDAKAEALIDWIYRFQSEERDSKCKVLVFTEFIPTQEMLYEFLTQRGFEVVCLNGSMGIEERRRVQSDFSKEARILISTDAGGEGLNLQFCNLVINYDIPWNPMRLEQRIGRVDRIGQRKNVRAINFVLEGTVEYRVRKVIEEKLLVIFNELGIDKTGDVLDSAQAEDIFTELYLEGILDPARVEEKIGQTLENLRYVISQVRSGNSIFDDQEKLSPDMVQTLLSHPLPYWVERMVINYITYNGGKAEKKGGYWNLTWPDGSKETHIVFYQKPEQMDFHLRRLFFEDKRIAQLLNHIPYFVPGQKIPVIELSDKSFNVAGFWSLWEIELKVGVNEDGYRIAQKPNKRFMAVFITDDDRNMMPTARYIWELLVVSDPKVVRYLDTDSSISAFERSRKVAEKQGFVIYEELLDSHKLYLSREIEKKQFYFENRRRAIERIGLPQVKKHRMEVLEKEIAEYKRYAEKMQQVVPHLKPLIVARVESR